MRVGVEILGNIHCHMYILETITGIQACFTVRQRVAFIGRLVFIVIHTITAWICIARVCLKRVTAVSASGSLCVVYQKVNILI